MLIPASSRSSMDRASDYGSEGWGFEYLRLHCIEAQVSSLLTWASALSGGEWVSGCGRR